MSLPQFARPVAAVDEDMQHGSLLAFWVRGVAGRAVWSASALAVPALAVLHDRQVAQAIVLYTAETTLAATVVRVRINRALRPLTWEDPVAAQLRDARQAAGTAAAVSFVLGFLVLAFFVAFDVRPQDLFDVSTWRGATFDGFGSRFRWMAAGLLLGALLDTWLAPVRSPVWLRAAAAWQMRRVAAPAFAYLPGVALTAWMGSTSGFLWPWFLLRAYTDLTALLPGERDRVRSAVPSDETDA